MAALALALTLVLTGCGDSAPTRAPGAGPVAGTGSDPASVPTVDPTVPTVPTGPGGVPAPAALPATRIVTLATGDGRRSARVHRPPVVAPGGGLIVVLHAAAMSAVDMENGFGWDGVADRDGVVVVYPDGLLDLFQDTWNAGACCSPATALGTDDVGFLDALVAALARGPDRVTGPVYAVGFSNGAMLAYAWACRRPGGLAGVGIVAGALVTGCAAPAPVTVVALHGDADPAIPVGGGPGPDGSWFPAVDESLAPFRAAAGCPADPVVVAGSAARVATWTCAGGRRVVRAVVGGLGHRWPGAGPAAGTASAPAGGTLSAATDATAFLWSELRAG